MLEVMLLEDSVDFSAAFWAVVPAGLVVPLEVLEAWARCLVVLVVVLVVLEMLLEARLEALEAWARCSEVSVAAPEVREALEAREVSVLFWEELRKWWRGFKRPRTYSEVTKKEGLRVVCLRESRWSVAASQVSVLIVHDVDEFPWLEISGYIHPHKSKNACIDVNSYF